jgi:hypothetical protein
VLAVREGRLPLAEPTHDLHLLDVVDAARRSVVAKAAVAVSSRFEPLDLKPDEIDGTRGRHHLHDHTRPPDEQ